MAEFAACALKMQAGDFSAAVPFLKRPSNLDGTLVGDVGFDPLVSFTHLCLIYERLTRYPFRASQMCSISAFSVRLS